MRPAPIPTAVSAGFMGMGIGMQSGGSFMGAASAANTRQMEMMNQGRNGMYGQNAGNFQGGMPGAGPNAGGGQNGPAGQTWTCACGSVEYGKILSRMRFSQTCARSLDLCLRRCEHGEILL